MRGLRTYGTRGERRGRVAGFVGRRMAYAVFLFHAASGTIGLAQSFTTLVNFDGSNGAFPTSMVQGRDGKLWGATNGVGRSSCGTAFKMTVAGALAKIFSFGCTNGNEPQGLTLGTDSEFYGVTFLGGANNKGTVFRLTTRGSLTVLLNFHGGDGSGPVGSLTQDADHDFYGATYAGGSALSYGTVFKITHSGTLTVLYDFGGLPNGFSPVASLVEGMDGNFYGTTISGGAANDGTVFSITPTGMFTSLYAFAGADGRAPAGALVQGADGNLYGTTAYGGANDRGMIFKITSSGTLTTLHNFDGTDGAGPFYLVQDTSGKFFGFTSSGGKSNYGTVFSLDMGLGPFVETVMNSGKVGTTVELLGQGFQGTTAVSFNGTAATFAIKSDTYLTATVPSAATTGFISVRTTSATLKSNKKFVVIPGFGFEDLQ